ncbi:glycosyltransferase [Eubacterium oxidoreducens]|uniref:Glycosyl transferase family 2 n=1 Tax=Eubacterium oxidoreducens TaxID=1732 RepID=A0A1G6BMG0_EUBOX|nr:glycosyltransferase [Eubacterium oxidoreducens]SDB21820.1 Glycosyl transferase family 2 [Eubacterium oxidoreducens]
MEQNTQVKVSVIVPIYNGEKYLKRCVDSICNQTLKEIEILLVDDGSMDESLKICEEYEAKDDRIKVIRQEHIGVAEARNKGMRLASGIYIGFVDCDDYIYPQMFETLYRICEEKNSSVAMCGAKKTTNVRIPSIEYEYRTQDVEMISATDYLKMMYADGSVDWKYLAVWNCIYKKEAIKNLEFQSDIAFEFGIFNLEFFLNQKEVPVINQEFYLWFQFSDSSSKVQSKINNLRRLAPYIQMMKTCEKNCPQVYPHVLEKVAKVVLAIMYEAKGFPEYKEVLQDMKSYREDVIKRYKENKMVSQKSRRRFIFLLKHRGIYNMYRDRMERKYG